MAKAHTYKVRTFDNEDLGTVQATTPAKALREVCGDRLADQDGRYGHLTDGRGVMALTVNAGRAYYGRGAWNDETGRRGPA